MSLLAHYYCAEEHLFFYLYGGELIACEMPERHVAFYEDYVAGVRT
ncbi:MAG: hypothetical protein ACRD2K_05370 [Terriglobales bacterium]